MAWHQAPRHIREFNGLRRSLVIRDREYGVFRERHALRGCPWAVRTRPVDEHGNALDSWGLPIPQETMRLAVAWVESCAAGARVNA